VPASRIFVTGSGCKAINFTLKALVEKGDEVVALTPIWKNLLSSLELAQCRITEVSMREMEGEWSLDLEALFAACTPATKLMLLTSPSNPAGWVMSHEEIRAILEFARERGIWVISDEVYSRMTYGRTHAPSFLEHALPDDRLFVVNSFSKAWAMTGWRLGWLVGPQAAEPHIRDIALYDYMGPVTFTQRGGIEALRQGEAFLATQMDLWNRNRHLLYDGFRQNPKVKAMMPESSFYYFLRVEGEEDDVAFCRRLVDEVGLSLAPGCAFGKAGRGYVRFCFAGDENRMSRALDRFMSALR